VAKKAKRRLEEDEQYRSFEFPTFDEPKFIHHEFEQTVATVIAFGFAVGLGAFSFAVGGTVLTALVALVVSVAVIVFTPWLFQRIRPLAAEYTKGEWAGILMMEIFGWLGIWFLLTDVFH
jgi:hypothetical protein